MNSEFQQDPTDYVHCDERCNNCRCVGECPHADEDAKEEYKKECDKIEEHNRQFLQEYWGM